MAENGKEKGDNVLILALASGMSVREAARKAGTSERTVHRRLNDAAFRDRVTETRDQLFQRAAGCLADAATEAVNTLRELLEDKSPMVRLGACRAILEHGPKLHENIEVTSR